MPRAHVRRERRRRDRQRLALALGLAALLAVLVTGYFALHGG